MTGLYAAICSGALYYLRRGTPKGKAAMITGVVLFFADGALEINHQFRYYFPGIDLTPLYLLLYTYVFITLFTTLSDRLKKHDFRLLNTGLHYAGILLYLVSLVYIFGLQETMLYENRYGQHFIAHWAGDALIVLMLWRLVVRMRAGILGIEPAVFTWLICTITVILLSAEGQLLVNAIFYSKTNPLPELARVYNKTALPILWGLCSFAFMWLGMKYKFKPSADHLAGHFLDHTGETVPFRYPEYSRCREDRRLFLSGRTSFGGIIHVSTIENNHHRG